MVMGGATIESRLTLDAKQFTSTMNAARKQVIKLADEAIRSSKRQAIAINSMVTAYSGLSTTVRAIKTTQTDLRATIDKNIDVIKKYGASSREVEKLTQSFSKNELEIENLLGTLRRLRNAANKEIGEAKKLAAAYERQTAAIRKLEARQDILTA
ncbi:unnamed protein product, partial [marine sediment metagenome]